MTNEQQLTSQEATPAPAITVTPAPTIELLRAGDRVLVSEYPNGPQFHTVTRANALMVWTEEVPEGFRRAFVLGVAR